MPSRPGAYVTYQDVVEYVRAELEPITRHQVDHDEWHRTEAANHTRLMWTQAMSLVSTIAAVVLAIVAIVGR